MPASTDLLAATLTGLDRLFDRLLPQIRRLVLENYTYLPQESAFSQSDISTPLDDQISDLILAAVSSQFPSLTLDSEERPASASGRLVFRLDPLDGSKHYWAGLDAFSTAASLSTSDATVWGLVYQPLLDKTYRASTLTPATLNQRPLTVSQTDLSQGFLLLEAPTLTLKQADPGRFRRYLELHDRLLGAAYRTRNLGNSSLAICAVAQGSAVAFIDLSGTTKLYDVEAARCIAERAGALAFYQTHSDKDRPAVSALDPAKKPLLHSLVVGNPTVIDTIKQLLA